MLWLWLGFAVGGSGAGECPRALVVTQKAGPEGTRLTPPPPRSLVVVRSRGSLVPSCLSRPRIYVHALDSSRSPFLSMPDRLADVVLA